MRFLSWLALLIGIGFVAYSAFLGTNYPGKPGWWISLICAALFVALSFFLGAKEMAKQRRRQD